MSLNPIPAVDYVPGDPETLLSAVALEHLRRMARDAGAPQRLLDQDDIELLRELGLWISGGLAREALLLAGSEEGLNVDYSQ